MQLLYIKVGGWLGEGGCQSNKATRSLMSYEQVILCWVKISE